MRNPDRHAGTPDRDACPQSLRSILAVVLMLAATLGAMPANAREFGLHKAKFLDELPDGDPLLELAHPIGVLVAEIGQHGPQSICTAAVISPKHVLTALHCLDQIMDGGAPPRLLMGGARAAQPKTSFELNPLPVERDEAANLAVLEIASGNPAAQFKSVTLLVRDPLPGDLLAILQFDGKTGQFRVSAGCSGRAVRNTVSSVPLNIISQQVQPDDPERTPIFANIDTNTELIEHKCDTSGGSSGALVFSLIDKAVVGMHIGGFDHANYAISIRDIVAASPTIAKVAWIKPSTAKPAAARGEKTFRVSIPNDEIHAAIRPGTRLTLNGKSHKVAAVETEGRMVALLGDASAMKKGLNELRVLAHEMKFWAENEKVSAFAEPYARSYAVIAAIDDYDRKGDSLKRGPTGFATLNGMRDRAEELRQTLIGAGFPGENITTLYDSAATRAGIENALTEFWQGGRFANADRVLFYFGGHGAGDPGGGYLVTFDFDPRRPTATGFLMGDFNARHFPFVKAKHFLVALDSCASGLAVPEMLDGAPTREQMVEFGKLAAIRANTEERARNMLVAGTSDQKALTETGGVFTRALVEGLRQNADMIDDGVILFDELALYVNTEVSKRAAQVGIRQDPRSFVATRFGLGKMVFLRGRPAQTTATDNGSAGGGAR